MAYLNLNRSLRIVKNCLIPAFKTKYFNQPLWVHYFVTRKCNLQCKYCYVRDNKKKDLDTNDAKRVIDKLYDLGIRAIAFFGGEPTIRKDFCELVKYAVDKGMFTQLSTNGILLDDKYIEKLGKSGIDFILLSVDSIIEFKESGKDLIKSKNVLESLLKASKKYGFGLQTNLVLSKKNLDTSIKTIKYIHDYDIPLTVGLINRNTYNDMKDNEMFFFNTKKEKEKLYKVIDEMIELKKKGMRIITPLSYFEGIKKFVDNYDCWDCKAGKYFFGVDSDGKVMLCAGLKPYNVSIFDIDKDFFKKRVNETEKTLKWCTKLCYSACSSATSYLIDNPINALLGK